MNKNKIPFDFFEGKKILITGGLGFIGSNLATRLCSLKSKVMLVDSMLPEYGGNLFNIISIKDNVKINISDIRDEHSLKFLVKEIDILFNLAGQNSHLDSMENPYNDLEINVKAQLSILEACRKYNRRIKIIFTSTRQLYGIPEYLPVDERHPSNPVDINGINKLAGEQYHLLYNKIYDIRTVILRLTNTIGPGMRIKDARQTFLGIWIKNILEGNSFEVWDGNQKRDFSDVKDVVDACLMTASSEKANGKIFNLGGTEPVTLKELANLLVQINGKGSFCLKTFPADRLKIDIGSYYSDFTKINHLLGWNPTVSLNETLTDLLDFYRKNLKEYL